MATVTTCVRLPAASAFVRYPFGVFASSCPPLRFVIKRHRAASLHADYRLEVCDTLFSLVSWGHPSLDSRRSVLLREMPDHDPACLTGERRIPNGAYGACPMDVWDFETYAPVLPFEESPSEAVFQALLAGRLDFRFGGRRMRGAFRLEFADRRVPVDWDDRSIVTGRSLDDIEREHQASARRLRGPWRIDPRHGRFGISPVWLTPRTQGP